MSPFLKITRMMTDRKQEDGKGGKGDRTFVDSRGTKSGLLDYPIYNFRTLRSPVGSLPIGLLLEFTIINVL